MRMGCRALLTTKQKAATNLITNQSIKKNVYGDRLLIEYQQIKLKDMTRQEELVQAARKEYPEWEEAQCHFIDGAHYADSHPHWISVESRKPKLKHKYEDTQCSDKVIVTNGEYRTSASWVHNTWAGWFGWFTDGDEELEGITHWMPLPQPPKEGGEE